MSNYYKIIDKVNKKIIDLNNNILEQNLNIYYLDSLQNIKTKISTFFYSFDISKWIKINIEYTNKQNIFTIKTTNLYFLLKKFIIIKHIKNKIQFSTYIFSIIRLFNNNERQKINFETDVKPILLFFYLKQIKNNPNNDLFLENLNYTSNKLETKKNDVLHEIKKDKINIIYKKNHTYNR